MTKLAPSAEVAYSSDALEADLTAPVAPLTDSMDHQTIPPQVIGEEAMFAALMADEGPDVEYFEQIKSKYQKEGASDEVEFLRKRAADRINKQQIDEGFNAVGDGRITPEQLEAILSQTEAVSEDDITDLHREYMVTAFSRSQAQSPADIEIQDMKVRELVGKGYSATQAIVDKMDAVKARMGTSFVKELTGLGVDLFPFVTTASFHRAFNKVFPNVDKGLADLSRGEVVMLFRENMGKMPPEEQYSVAVDLINALVSESGTLSGHDFQTLMLMEEALQPGAFQEGALGINWDRWIGNGISVLDGIAAGGVANRLFQATKNILKPGTVLSTVNIADPKQAGELAAAGIKKDLSDALGHTPEELTEVLAYPQSWRGNIEHLPPQVIERLAARDNSIADLMQRTEGTTLTISDADKRAVRNNFRSEVKEVGNSVMMGSKYEARATDTGIEYAAMYGVKKSDGTHAPFQTAKKAAEEAKRSFPTAKKVEIWERKPNGDMVPAKFGKTGIAGSRRNGEFFYRIEGFKTYSQTEAAENMLFIEPGTVLRSGPIAKWVFDPATRFAKWMSEGLAGAGDQARGIAAQIRDDIAKDFLKLNLKKKREVVHLLNKYGDDPTMDISKIARLANNDIDVVEGFISYRQTMDALYELENRNFRNDLLKQGAKWINSGDFQNIGVKAGIVGIREEYKRAGMRLEVYDPAKGKTVQLSDKQIEKMYDEGNSLYRTIEPVGDVHERVDLVMLTNAPSQLAELPAYVLRKIDGYIPRMYKDTYFIRQTFSGKKNGYSAQNTQILRAVGDISDANMVKEALEAEGKRGIEIIHDRKLTPQERSTMNYEDNISLGRMFYHKRAQNELSGVDGLANIADPVEAMLQAVESTAQYVSHADILGMLKQRWINTYAKDQNLVHRDVFPMNRADIGDKYVLTGPEKAQALELWDHIKRAEGMMAPESEAWRDGFLSFAEWIVGDSTRKSLFGKLKAGAAAPVRSLAHNSINHMARTHAFWNLIALNPIRQMYVQSMQFHYLWGIDPMNAPKLWMDGQRLSVAFQMKNTAPKVYATLRDGFAKKLGMSSKEYDEFVDMYSKTGIPHSVDSHDYVRNTLATYSNAVNGNIVQRGYNKTKNLVMAPARLLKKAGFDQGELSNLSATFMMARRQYLKATGKKQLKTRADFDAVAANARNLALDMTHSGAFRYQDGALSAALQFFQIQHKAFLSMWPKRLGGSAAFTPQQKFRIFLGQVLVNGTTGFGLHKAYKEVQEALGFQLPEEAEDIVVGGMFEYLMNGMLAQVSDDHQTLNFAETIAPLGGLNAENFVDVAMGNKTLPETFAAWNVVTRYRDISKLLVAWHQYPELNDDKGFLDYMSAFGTMTSGWSNALKADAALRLGYHVSSSGSPTVQSSFHSAILQGTLGIAPRSMEEYYALQREHTDRIQTKGNLVDERTDEIARNLLNQLTRTTTFYDNELDIDLENLGGENDYALHQLHQERMTKAHQMFTNILRIYDPIERDRIWERFYELASEERTAGADGLIKKLTNMMLKGDVSSGAEELIYRMRASKLYDPNSQKGQVIEWQLNEIWKSLTAMQRFSDDNMKRITGDIDGED